MYYIIQKEVDELLAKGSIEPWMGETGFNSALNYLIAYAHTSF